MFIVENGDLKQSCYSYKDVVSNILGEMRESRLNDYLPTINDKTILEQLQSLDNLALLITPSKIFYVEGELFHSDAFYARLMRSHLVSNNYVIYSEGSYGEIYYSIVVDEHIHCIDLDVKPIEVVEPQEVKEDDVSVSEENSEPSKDTSLVEVSSEVQPPQEKPKKTRKSTKKGKEK